MQPGAGWGQDPVFWKFSSLREQKSRFLCHLDIEHSLLLWVPQPCASTIPNHLNSPLTRPRVHSRACGYMRLYSAQWCSVGVHRHNMCVVFALLHHSKKVCRVFLCRVCMFSTCLHGFLSGAKPRHWSQGYMDCRESISLGRSMKDNPLRITTWCVSPQTVLVSFS